MKARSFNSTTIVPRAILTAWRKNIVCDTVEIHPPHNCSAHTTVFYVMISMNRAQRFNAVKAIRSSARRNTKLQFTFSNCPDCNRNGTSCSFVACGALFREDRISLARPLLSLQLDDVPENKSVIGFRRKIPEQEADGVEEVFSHLSPATPPHFPSCQSPAINFKSILPRR